MHPDNSSVMKSYSVSLAGLLTALSGEVYVTLDVSRGYISVWFKRSLADFTDIQHRERQSSQQT